MEFIHIFKRKLLYLVMCWTRMVNQRRELMTLGFLAGATT